MGGIRSGIENRLIVVLWVVLALLVYGNNFEMQAVCLCIFLLGNR